MLRDTWLVFARVMLPVVRNPVAVVFGLAQPLLYLALFGPLLGDSGWQWFVPGLLVQLALFGTAYAGFSLLPEVRTGVMERLRVTPVSRVALLVGRVGKDVVLLVVQGLLIVLAAMLFGFRASAGDVLLGLGLVALLGIAIGSASYAIALKVKLEYVFASVLSSTIVPLMLLSGVLLPMSNGPRWLYWLSRVNPLAHVVDAERSIFNTGSVLLGLISVSALVLTGVFYGVRTFHRESA
ncbi:ABC transporter permease [Lentzea flava]|uniref:Transport permease protein n=1 Tax=Lentzea flava TaxID=103732 RepID=A0ABQ2V7W9_9PSEU|nr:ABC transporter permease [Lentzea flava]MCP2203920.1 ABC-2 type transport system permease protein [Lentzea flava]GGU72877.1 transport permease protein [Lentzea flava]